MHAHVDYHAPEWSVRLTQNTGSRRCSSLTQGILQFCSFQKQYDTVREIEGSVYTALALLRTRLADDAFPGARVIRNKVAKWIIAQAYLGFGWLPTNRENGVDEWTWERVVKTGLVGNEEIQHLLSLHPGEYPVSEVGAKV